MIISLDFIIISLTIILLAFIIRAIPIILCKNNLGVDHWFWKAYIETYRKTKKFPPDLPQYILEKYQWYPPLFPLLMAHLPPVIFDKYNHFVTIGIDLLRLLVLMYFSNIVSNGNSNLVLIVGLMYSTSPILVSYNIQLNPRGLGALFLDLLIVLIFSIYFFDAPKWIWILILFLSALILLTHKMTTQLFWFLCLCAGFLSQDWRFFALIPLSIICALVVSKGFYWNVMKAHWDIVTFWHRNWKWLQAHPLKESPIYGDANYETPTKFHQRGLRGITRHIKYLFGYNPSAWFLFFTVILSLSISQYESSINSITNWILTWYLIILIFAIITVFIPFLKCLGSGYLYLYNLSFPSAILWGLSLDMIEFKELLFLIFLFSLLLNISSILIFYKNLKKSLTQRVDIEFENLLNLLKNLPEGTVICLPPQWYDVVAYKTKKSVLYGGHGYGFRLLEPVFPRLLIPIEEIINRYGVRYLITFEGYLNEKFLRKLNYKSLYSFGKYILYIIF